MTDFSLKICRTCLRSESLHPIFQEKDSNDYVWAIFITTGLKVLCNDGLPQKICSICINFLKKCLKFRKLCIEAETKLLQIKNHASPLTENVPSPVKKTINDLTVESENNYSKSDYETSDDEKPLKYLIKQEFQVDELKEEDGTHANDSAANAKLKDPNTYQYQASLKTIDQVIENSSIPNSETLTNNLPPDTDSQISYPIDRHLHSLVVVKNEKRVICKLCQKELAISSIDNHMMVLHPGVDERKVKCDMCDVFVLREKMKRHIMTRHGLNNYKCAYCETEFSKKYELLSHVTKCSKKKKKRKVSDVSRQPIECDVCHKKMQRASLKLHKDIQHAGLGPVCDHCGRRFGNKFRLTEHLRAKHNYEKFQCKQCDFKSSSTMAMRNHERRHRGEKPFVCERCGAKFHAAYLLNQHKQSHRTHKLVQCNLCPSSFKTKNSLHMHKLACHSNTSYTCTMCSRVYRCRHYAVKHLRSVHHHTGPIGQLLNLYLINMDSVTNNGISVTGTVYNLTGQVNVTVNNDSSQNVVNTTDILTCTVNNITSSVNHSTANVSGSALENIVTEAANNYTGIVNSVTENVMKNSVMRTVNSVTGSVSSVTSTLKSTECNVNRKSDTNSDRAEFGVYTK